MAGKPLATTAIAFASLIGLISPAAAGPIAVHTQILQAARGDEIPVSGLGNWAVLTTGGGVDANLTVPADQTHASQFVVGFWPVMGFRDRAQYEAQRGTVVTVPELPVSIYDEVWNGELGQGELQRAYFHSIVSARVSPTVGQNSVDWQMIESSQQVRFGDTLVSISYTPVRMPDGSPQIQFMDGSPAIGFPGPTYYPTLLEETVDVWRSPSDPGSAGPTDPGPGGSGGAGDPSGGPPPEAPEPAGTLMLAGLAVGAPVARRAGRA